MMIANMLATGPWMALLSVLAIVGIIVAGGFIVAVIGRMMLGVFAHPAQQSNNQTYTPQYTYQNNNAQAYVPQAEEPQHIPVRESVAPQDDYAYDVDEGKAKAEEEALSKELEGAEEDDFFKDFTGDNDSRFGADDDLMSMIDEISQDVLDEEQENMIKAEQEESSANQSILDKYSIDNYFEEEEEPVEVVEDTVETIVDEETISEINALKQQVKEIVETMEENKNQTETFNEQLINILNELKEANKREVRTEQDAEREINELKQQLEESRQEMERQVQERIEEEDETTQASLQEQLDKANEEIEELKLELSELLDKMNEGGEEVKPDEVDEIEALRKEVREMLEGMREESEAKTNNFNAQVLEMLQELKEANVKQSEQAKLETNEEAVEEVATWQEELELTEQEIQKQYQEELLHKTEEEKSELRAEMKEYTAEITKLKEQLNILMAKFAEQDENAKTENQALINQLQAEREERAKLEQEKVAKEIEQQEQLEALRKENEALADKLQARVEGAYEPLTEDEMEDLYSNATIIDYSAISQMNQEQIDEKVKVGLKASQQEIDELKEQLARLTSFMQDREGGLAEQLNVHEVKNVAFDINEVKDVDVKDVETMLSEAFIENITEIVVLRQDLANIKANIEGQYKDQLANTEAGMEYDQVAKLQTVAEKIDALNAELNTLDSQLEEEQGKVDVLGVQYAEEIANARAEKVAEINAKGYEAEVAVIGPKNNQVALVVNNKEVAEVIDLAGATKVVEKEIEEAINIKLAKFINDIERLRKQIASLLDDSDEGASEVKPEAVPVVRSPLFDVEAIKKITAQEVEIKVQERLAEAMKEIEEMKKQLEESKREIEKEYRMAKNSEEEVKERLKDSAAEVVELKEQLQDLTEQLSIEHEEAKQNSEVIVEQLVQDRKAKEEITKQLVFNSEDNDMAVATMAEVTVIGPTNNQVALVTGVTSVSEEVEDIPTIDINTVKKLAEEEIEEKVEQRMTSSIVEIEELKKQILNLSIQIQEIKNGTVPTVEEKPIVFHYSSEQAYVERIAVLEERLKNAKKDLKINNKELKPLQKVNRTLERDKIKLRRRDAIAAKKKVALYGVNNYVDIDREKAEKLAQELEMLDGLRLSVSHCEEVMNANIDRYPILVHTDKILRENIANIESDLASLNKELQILREKAE